MNILANISSKPFQNASVPTYLPYPWLKLCHAHLPSSCLCIPVVLVYIPDHLPPFTVSSFPCSVSPSLPFSSATYLTPVAFPSTSLSASSFVHLNWTSPHSTPQHCFSPLLSPLCAEVLILSVPPPYVDKTAFSPIWVGHEEKIMHCSPSHPHLQQLPPAQPTAAEGTATGDAALQPARDSDALQGWSMHMRTLPGLEDGQWGRYPQEIWTLKRPTSFYLQFVQNADFTWLSKPGEIFRGVEKSHLSLIEKQPFPTVFWMSATKQREAWKLQH